MKILALERAEPNRTTADFQPHLKAEARRVWELQQAGIIREVHFDARAHTAVLTLECAGWEDAQTALDTLPLVERGLITFELIALTPYDGFARLFAGDA